MKWQPRVTARVLIVEDDPEQLEGIKRDLEKIHVDRRGDFGIDKFDTKLAGAEDEAERFLAESKTSPYDLMLLDLGIPKKKGLVDVPENGERLLNKARKMRAVKEIVVISVWKEFDYVASAFRNGVLDFVAKPFKTSELQSRIMECWKRLMAKESARLLGEGRIRELIPYAEKGLAHRFTTCFSSLLRTLVHSSEDMERYMGERYGLDRQRDSQDFFFKCINEQEETVRKATHEWEALKKSLQSPEESAGGASAEALLKDLLRKLSPCFIVKNAVVELNNESMTEIFTFDDDVRAVLREILLGTLNKLADYGDAEQKIDVRVKDVNGQVAVKFTDRVESISVSEAKNINEGANIFPDHRFGREWGLSVVQHIAMRGGGRLEIEPLAKGNIVTYFIPPATN